MPTQHRDIQSALIDQRLDDAGDTGDLTAFADGATMQFRAATLDEAIALAEQSLGSRVRVVAANRIRRGGIGGFFASDLGVEVTVALEDETVEQALERLVAETAAEERTQWTERRTLASAMAATAQPVEAPIETSTNTLARVDRLIEELQSLTATPAVTAPLFGAESVRPTPGRLRRDAERAVQPASEHVGQPASEHSGQPGSEHVGQHPLEQAIEQPDVLPGLRRTLSSDRTTAAFPASPSEIARAASAAAAAKSRSIGVADAVGVAFTTPAALTSMLDAATAVTEPSATSMALPVERPAEVPVESAMPQRHVELAVAAADQLIEALKSDDGVKRLSVRVVLRTGEQREVAAEAEWEAS